MKKFTELLAVRGVSVYLHWSTLLVGGVILLGAFDKPAETLAAWGSYFSVLLIHECGHMVVAQRKGCHVSAIELYPIHGLLRYSEPWSRYDDSVIAWGGVLAQAIVGIPLVAFAAIAGFTRYPVLNVVIGVLGYYSLLIAALNLLPIRPLDGAKAWYVFAKWFKRKEQAPPRRENPWRSYR
jgi:Zn-dependent protease